MPRTRKNQPLAGAEHRHGGGQRVWRAALHWPTDRYPSFRVVFKEEREGTWEWTTRNATTELEGRRLLKQVDDALAAMQPAPARQQVQAARTVEALGVLYLEDSRRRAKAVRTAEGRESVLRAHITPVIGELPVNRWRAEHTQQVLTRSGESVGRQRLTDIRANLASMVRLAWREGWLDRGVDTLDGVELRRAQTEYGASDDYVSPELRPSRAQVETMAAAADALCVGGEGVDEPVRRLPLLGVKIRVAAYGGLRLGEQNGRDCCKFG